MAAFVDTSGVVKLYVAETGSRWMSQVIRPRGITISAVTVTEVGSTLSRRVRDGSLTPHQARLAWALFRRQSRGFVTMPLSPDSLRAAARLTARSVEPLRALDAIQLQGAIEAVRDARRNGLAAPTFISADERLLRAAAAVGLSIDDPRRHT